VCIRNNDEFKVKMTTFWGLPSFGENVKNGFKELGFIEFSFDFMTVNRPNAISIPLCQYNTVLTVSRPYLNKKPETFKKSLDFVGLTENIAILPTHPASTPHPVTPARYAQATWA